MIHQHTQFQANRSMHVPGNTQKPQICPVSLSQRDAERRKINRPELKSNQFWRWSGYISMQNFRLFPSCVLREMPGNHKFYPFHHVKMAPKLEKPTDRDYNLKTSGGCKYISACKIPGHSLHAFSGKWPEPPNLTRFTESKWRQHGQREGN